MKLLLRVAGCVVLALCLSTADASVDGSLGFYDTQLAETVDGSINAGGTGYFDTGVLVGTGTPVKSLNSTDVMDGTYSCQSTATVTESNSAAHFSFTKVLPVDARFTIDDLENMSFGFKMNTTDTDWTCQVSWLAADYTLLAKFVQSSRNGNLSTFWGVGNEWQYIHWKNNAAFTKYSGAGEVAQIKFDMRYVGNASGQDNSIFVDHMYITISPDDFFTDSVNGGLGEGENGYFDIGLINGSGTPIKFVSTSDVKAGNYSCRASATITNSVSDSHFSLTKVLPYKHRFHFEDLESMSFNYAMMTTDPDWTCQISWLSADYSLVAKFVQSSQNGTSSTFWDAGSGYKWDYDNWRDDPGFTLYSDVDEVAQIKFDMRYVGDSSGQWNGIAVDNMDIVFSKPFRIGWWTRLSTSTFGYVPAIANSSNGIIICYSYGTDADKENWLNEANDHGLKVIVEIPRESVENKDSASIQSFVNTFDSHPAVFGWFIYDEPDTDLIDECEDAYQDITGISNKKCFLCFFNGNIDNMDDFAAAYDIALYDNYPCDEGESEFEGFENEYNWLGMLKSTGYKININRVSQNAASAGKPWWSIVQAFGRQPDGATEARLPTKAEYRFMIYYSLLKNSESIFTWVYNRSIASLEDSGDPYPYSGVVWAADIPVSVANEIALCGNAIRAGRKSGLSDNRPDVYTVLYRDPFNGKRFVLALNPDDSSKTVTITLGVGNYTSADPIDAGDTRTISNNQFTDTLTEYEVIIYELKP